MLYWVARPLVVQRAGPQDPDAIPLDGSPIPLAGGVVWHRDRRTGDSENLAGWYDTDEGLNEVRGLNKGFGLHLLLFPFKEFGIHLSHSQ